MDKIHVFWRGPIGKICIAGAKYHVMSMQYQRQSQAFGFRKCFICNLT